MLIYGASGHAKVILDCLIESDEPVRAIFDDNPMIKKLLDQDVIHNYRSDLFPGENLLIAIGDNKIRKTLADKISIAHPPPSAIINHSAVISEDVQLGLGTVVLHNATIQSSTKSGNYVIINTGSTVDHDCLLGDFVHIAPNSTLCGGVTVGEGTLIGAGSVVIPTISIGKWCVIGAGSVVINDVPDHSLVVGNPGKVVKNLSN